MSPLQFRWHRILAVYLSLAVISLVAAACTPPPLQSVFLFIGGAFIAAFFPLIMTIYFLRGLLRIH